MGERGVDRIPTLHIIADNIPQAHYRTTKAVYEQGIDFETEYDRRSRKTGELIDPPSRDARVLVDIANPFNEPRYPVIGHSEFGKYIAEIMGAKDHLVLPFDRLRAQLEKGKLEATEWPYSYSQRLRAYPLGDGRTLNQLEVMLNKLASSPITRRAVALTGVPEIDNYTDDPPCLREIQLRCTTDEKGILRLHMMTTWRSRDLYRAWPDNVIGMTFLQQVLAQDLNDRIAAIRGITDDRKLVEVGSYSEDSRSNHIYGQTLVEEQPEKYIGMGEKAVLGRVLDKEKATGLIIYEMQNLKLEGTWKFGEEQIALIDGLIGDLESGRLAA